MNRLSIQSKLLLMLLGASIASILAIACIGYMSGRDALVDCLRNELAGLCRVKSNAIQNELRSLRAQVVTLSADETFLRAFKELKEGFEQLNEKPIPKEWDDKLTAFYRDEYLPKLRQSLDAEPVLETYVPRVPASRHLQYQYIANNPHPYLKKGELASSGDGSAYDAAHKKHHPFLRVVNQTYGFEDLMLVDSETGEVVYTEQKSTEFGTNLLSGPYSNSNLAELFREIQKGMDRDDYRMVDFDRYRPNLNAPAAFIASPIFDENKMVAVLVLQFPINEINRIMTGNLDWEREGLGQTGETYLVGSDLFMRSRSRELYKVREQAPERLGASGATAEQIEKERAEGTERFLAKLQAAGATETAINRLRQSGTAVLTLRVASEAARLAIAGQSGTIFQNDYRGVPTLASFLPLEIQGLIHGESKRWGVVAKMDLDEAMEPIVRFRRRVLSTAVIIMLLVTLLALLLARVFTRPIHALIRGAKRIGRGEVDVKVRVRSRDEFRELADAFNTMSTNLKAKSELIEQKVRENEELLLNILPSVAVQRHKQGEKQFSENFADVTVMFAEIEGLSDLSGDQSADKTMALLNELVVAFDETAERHGVEKVKTVGGSYMAVCGLSVQRPDHTNRVVEFAKDLLRIMRRFDAEREARLNLDIAINCGPVVGGVVGQNKFIYDLWGDTVHIARAIQSSGGKHPIRVTEEVRERLGDLQEFDPCGEVEIPGRGATQVWSVKV
ncbi:MAG: adenylate/guanylate cyclase domain-containing protein [Isosphaeraceae bacterium]